MKKLSISLLTIFFLLQAGTSLAQSKKVTINVSATILPLLELEVVGPNSGHLDFGDIQKLHGQDVVSTSEEVIIQAKSNLGSPYHVTQSLIHPIVNENGTSLPENALTMEAVHLNTRGSLMHAGAVTTQNQVLFESDEVGKSETIKAKYQLKVAPSQEAGDYQSKLLYSIVTA